MGHVISVTGNTAKVKTIIDPSSSTSVTVSTTRDSIVCKGDLASEYKLKGVYVPTEASVVEGDSVETSGMGGMYPKGIHIGKIVDIVNTKNIIDRYILVKPAVDFNKLETLLVVIGV